jgi:hypothetical protein
MHGDCHVTWSVLLREQHRLRVFVNRVLRKVLEAKTDGVAGGLRKLHKGELHDLSCPSDIIRLME